MGQWLQDLWDAFVVILKSFMLTLYDMAKDFMISALDLFLDITYLILDSFGELFTAADLTQYISMIPDDVRNIMGLIGIGQAMSLIVTAITIRIILQLIPFTRLGS